MDTQNPTEGEGMTSQINPEPMPEMQNQAPLNNNEDKKFPTIPVFGALILIVAIVGAIYYFTPQLWPTKESSSFNIPQNGEYVILFDRGSLYSLNLENAETEKLGTFENGSEITTATESVISEDGSHISLAVPNVDGGNDVVVFSDFTVYENVTSQSKYFQALSVSNQGAVLFAETGTETSLDSEVYFVSRAVGGSVESLGSADVPFFADGGSKVIHGTVSGFKMIDFSSGDSLESETPFVPIPWKVDLSKENNFFSVLGVNGAAYVYSVPSTRPFALVESYALPFPGTYDATVSSNGDIALLRNLNGDIVVTVYRKEMREAVSYLPGLSKDALIISWNK